VSRFLVGIAKYGRDPHVRCFEDHMRAVAAALRDLGHEVEYATEDALKRGGRLIVWGANNITEAPNARAELQERYPAGTIVFQTEQVSAITDPAYFMQNWAQFRGHPVLDYARSNVQALAALGIKATLCPLGYHPSMVKIEPAVEEDIDVLFYGSNAGPRREITTALRESGLNFVHLFNVYNEERDAAIARSKVVINMRAYQGGVFEIFRCSHLFANGKCVVNESGGRDAELEDLARRCTSYVPRSQLVDECRRLVSDAVARRAVAERGRDEFRKISMVESVRSALEEIGG
jgi:hypothetical protein